MKSVALFLAAVVAACGGSEGASVNENGELKPGEILTPVDLEMTSEFDDGHFMVRAARQASNQSLDVAYSRCTRIQGTAGSYNCTYSLESAPETVLTAKVVQCHLAFEFDECSEADFSY